MPDDTLATPVSASPAGPAAPDSDAAGPGLAPLRFSLGTLLLVMSGLCVLFAAMAALGPMGGLALLLAALALLGHIAGNSLGTTLRDTGGRSRPDDSTYGLPATGSARELPALARPQLSEPQCLGASPYWGIGLGAGLGGLLGAALLAWINWSHATIANVAFGGCAFAIIGGLAGYGIACFTRVFLGAWNQAGRR